MRAGSIARASTLIILTLVLTACGRTDSSLRIQDPEQAAQRFADAVVSGNSAEVLATSELKPDDSQLNRMLQVYADLDEPVAGSIVHLESGQEEPGSRVYWIQSITMPDGQEFIPFSEGSAEFTPIVVIELSGGGWQVGVPDMLLQ